MKLKKVSANERIRAEHINQLIDAYNALSNIAVGPGLEKKQTDTGVSFWLINTQPTTKTTKPLSGDPKQLSHVQGTQDTDTYDRDTDKAPVSFTDITEIKYDETTHQLIFRYRTIVADGIKSVSAESDPVIITTTVGCS